MKLLILAPLSFCPVDYCPDDARPTSKEVWDYARSVVDGLVEVVYLTEPEPAPFPEVGFHLAAYVNENGIAEGLPLSWRVDDPIGTTRHVFHGNVMIVRERVDAEGDTHYADLTRDDEVWLEEHLGMALPAIVLASEGLPS
jgi:hypothetical protein